VSRDRNDFALYDAAASRRAMGHAFSGDTGKFVETRPLTVVQASRFEHSEPPRQKDDPTNSAQLEPTIGNKTMIFNALRTLAIALSLAMSTFAATAAAEEAQPSSSERALTLLKKSADRLSAAKGFTVKTSSSIESPSLGGPMITYFSGSTVAVQRPNKLMAKRTGDGKRFDLYYDGKTFTGVDPRLNLYARMEAPPTLDELVPAIMEKVRMPLPFADLLFSDVFNAMARDLTYSEALGTVNVNGVPCEHLLFAAPGIEWQIWIGPPKDPLPCRLAVTYVDDERRPRFMVTFSDWNLKARLPASHFEYTPPPSAKRIDFRPHSANAHN